MKSFENGLIAGPGLVEARRIEDTGVSFYRGFEGAGITSGEGMTREYTKRMHWQANKEKQVRR